MMNQIKHGMSFILGVLYMLLVGLLLTHWGWNVATWILLTTLVIATALIFVLIGNFLAVHWKKR